MCNTNVRKDHNPDLHSFDACVTETQIVILNPVDCDPVLLLRVNRV